jgi:hypothetical protein
MKQIAFLWVMGAGVLLAACGGKVFIDLPTGSSTTGGSGGTGLGDVGASGGVGNIGNGGVGASGGVVSDGGFGGLTTVGPGGSGGIGGGPCATCAEEINEPQAGPLCPGLSEKLYNQLVTCICDGPCSMQCNDPCNGMGGDLPPPCLMCIQDPTPQGCGDQLSQCVNDA